MKYSQISRRCFQAAVLPSLIWATGAVILGKTTFSGMIGLFFISFFFALPPTYLIGFPYIILLRKIDAITWVNVCIGSTAAGLITMLLLLWDTTWFDISSAFSYYFIGAVIGLSSGIGFCLGKGKNNLFKQGTFSS